MAAEAEGGWRTPAGCEPLRCSPTGGRRASAQQDGRTWRCPTSSPAATGAKPPPNLPTIRWRWSPPPVTAAAGWLQPLRIPSPSTTRPGIPPGAHSGDQSMPAYNVYDAPPGSLIRYFDGARSRRPFTKGLAGRKAETVSAGSCASNQPRTRHLYRAGLDYPARGQLLRRLGDPRYHHAHAFGRQRARLRDRRTAESRHGPRASSIGDDEELLHLAENREAAELWLAKAGYSRCRLEEIGR